MQFHLDITHSVDFHVQVSLATSMHAYNNLDALIAVVSLQAIYVINAVVTSCDGALTTEYTSILC